MSVRAWFCPFRPAFCLGFNVTCEYLVTHVLPALGDTAMFSNPDDRMEENMVAFLTQYADRLSDFDRCVSPAFRYSCIARACPPPRAVQTWQHFLFLARYLLGLHPPKPFPALRFHVPSRLFYFPAPWRVLQQHAVAS